MESGRLFMDKHVHVRLWKIGCFIGFCSIFSVSAEIELEQDEMSVEYQEIDLVSEVDEEILKPEALSVDASLNYKQTVQLKTQDEEGLELDLDVLFETQYFKDLYQRMGDQLLMTSTIVLTLEKIEANNIGLFDDLDKLAWLKSIYVESGKQELDHLLNMLESNHASILDQLFDYCNDQLLSYSMIDKKGQGVDVQEQDPLAITLDTEPQEEVLEPEVFNSEDIYIERINL